MKTLKVATAFSGGFVKKVKGFEDEYIVSDDGRIFSIPRNGTTHELKQLKPSKSKTGYMRVVLSKNNKKTYKNVHKIVADNFLKYSKGMTVNHIDGNKENNNLSNLEFISSKENTRHAIRIGLAHRNGAKNPNFKEWYAVTDNKEIILFSNTTIKDFAKSKNISEHTIFRSIKYKSKVGQRASNCNGWSFYYV